jgi:preprotein translocase subunit SecE
MAFVKDDNTDRTSSEDPDVIDAEYSVEKSQEIEKKVKPGHVEVPGAREPSSGAAPGFFTVYKKGQGYWTRICTAIASAFFVVVTANFVWQELRPWIIPALTPENATSEQSLKAIMLAGRITAGLSVAIAISLSYVLWRMMNKPSNVDFLIATDSEMKKVNWTSRRELIGSTKVVIVFMILIAALLFTLDMYFTRVFHLFGVLDADSPVWIYVDKGLGLGTKGKVTLDVLSGTIVFGGAAWAVYGTIRGR